MAKPLVTVFENHLGETAYQPTLSNHERLYNDYTSSWGGEPPIRVWLSAVPSYRSSAYEPVLYGSEWRARRVAERETRRREKRRRRTFRRVANDRETE